MGYDPDLFWQLNTIYWPTEGFVYYFTIVPLQIFWSYLCRQHAYEKDVFCAEAQFLPIAVDILFAADILFTANGPVSSVYILS